MILSYCDLNNTVCQILTVGLEFYEMETKPTYGDQSPEPIYVGDV